MCNVWSICNGLTEDDLDARLVGDGLVESPLVGDAVHEARECLVLVLGAHDAADARVRLLEQLVQQESSEKTRRAREQHGVRCVPRARRREALRVRAAAHLVRQGARVRLNRGALLLFGVDATLTPQLVEHGRQLAEARVGKDHWQRQLDV